ncbi:MAG: ADOP family duplicated permease [Bryobacteraceae bacterium]|jgi:putative ABC transport system permease protein
MWHELRITARVLTKNWAFTLAAAISLALGLGVNATVFGLVDAVFWKPLPVRDPARLVSVYTMSAAGRTPAFTSTSYADFEELGKLPVFAGSAAFGRFPVRLRSGQDTERLSTEIITPGYFDVVGISPALGRFLDAADHRAGAEPAVVISYALWNRLFARDRSVLGRQISLNDRAFSIVGVAPEGYRGTVLDWGQPPGAWISLAQVGATEASFRRFDLPAQHEFRWMLMVARLAQGVSMEAAQAALDVAGRSLALEYPKTNGVQSFRLLSSIQSRFWPGRREESIRFAELLAAVALAVLLIACCNLSSTLIARTIAREREIGIRLAIGAGKGRLVRESLLEALLLAGCGCALCIPVSLALSNGLRAFPAPFLVPIAVDIALDWRAAAFLGVASVALAAVAGAAAAWKAAGHDVSLALKGTQRSGAFARHAFLVAQVALSFVLLIGAGLLAKSLASLEHANAGYQTGGVTVARVELTFADSSAESGALKDREILARAAAIPGVDHAALAWEIFPTLIQYARPVRAADSGVEIPVERTGVSAEFFETLRMRFIDGRDFRGDEPRQVAIMNQTAARRFWNGDSAIGKRIRLQGETEDREVVGVVRDAKYHEFDETPTPYLFLPMSQMVVNREPALFVRSSRGTLSGVALRRAIAEDHALLVTEAEPLEDYIASRLSQPRLAAFLAGGVAFIGVILSAIGLDSILAYFVNRQLREIGIRVAVGATNVDVIRLIARRGVVLGLAGVALGGLMGMWGARFVGSQLHGVAASDPAVYCGAGAVFALVILTASIGPAVRAMRIDPAALLRSN